jgi:hypothetical protein
MDVSVQAVATKSAAEAFGVLVEPLVESESTLPGFGS